VATGFQATYIFWLDLLGAVVVPLWVIVLVDFFWVRRGRYDNDLFRPEGGRYWYGDGWNWRAVACLVGGSLAYAVLAFIFPEVRETVPASFPVGIGVALVYALLMRGERAARA
jgi:NCS1 family nucleobase:cation symporter-1